MLRAVQTILKAAAVAVLLIGCTQTSQERVQHFSEDGVYLFQHGQYDAARQSFEAAQQLQPKDVSLLYNLGQCHDRQGAASKAEGYYRECLKDAPNHPACRRALALLLLREGRRDEADQLIEGWLAQEPELAAAYAEDGWRLRQDGDLPGAQARLQQALERDPHNVRALVELGILFELMERPGRALVLYEQALAENPQQPEVSARVNLLKARGVRSPQPD